MQNPKFAGTANISVSPHSLGRNRKPFAPHGQFKKRQGARTGQNSNQGYTQRAVERRCFICNKVGHIAKFCDNRRQTVSAVNSVNSTEIDAAQVNRVVACSIGCSSGLVCRPLRCENLRRASNICDRSRPMLFVSRSETTKVANFNSQLSLSSIK